MSNLNFEYLRARNFLCFGPDGIEVDLTKMGNIVLVEGKNYDDEKSPGNPGSNGSGKSSLLSIPSYALYGQTSKRGLRQEDFIHSKVGKNCEGEARWSVGGMRYRVVRTHRPSSVRLWESADGVWDDTTEITAGAGIRETNRLIEARVGLNYRAFANVVCFDDRNSTSFLECDAATKREIVENLLSLDKYREYSRIAKEYVKESERAAKSLGVEYDRLVQLGDQARARRAKLESQEEAWRVATRARADALLQRAREARAELSRLEGANDAWKESQARIAALASAVSSLEARRRKVDEVLLQGKASLVRSENVLLAARSRELELVAEQQRWQQECARLESKSRKLARSVAGVVCDECFMVGDASHYERHRESTEEKLGVAREELARAEGDVATHVREVRLPAHRGVLSLSEALREANEKGAQWERQIARDRAEVARLEGTTRPDVVSDCKVLEREAAGLEREASELHATARGPGPYARNLADAAAEVEALESERRDKKDEVGREETMLPYYSYWVNAFGDNGIRKFVIDGIVPALNARIAHWLRCLIYGNITLTFDNALRETIRRVPFDAEEFVYEAMSGGEQRRINLAVTLAFAHIMTLNSGRSPNISFFDEIAINIDENGIDGIFAMIREQSRDKKVFVTTHDPLLLDHLRGCETFRIERRDGFTRRAS